MEKDFLDRAALVTGAGTGIGRATALALARRGAFVGVHYNNSANGAVETLDAIRESGGCAVAVAEDRIAEAMRRAVASEGISFCPEAAACVLALERLARDEVIRPNDRVVIFNTGSAAKYIETVKLDLPIIHDRDDVDYDRFA